MATMVKVSPEVQKNLDIFIKHMVYKFVQCVVQSRGMEKIHTRSRVIVSTSDWFNLTIQENPVVSEEIKTIFHGRPVDLLQPISVEIYLKTTEDETMVLEHWWLLKTDKTSPMEQGYKGEFYDNLITILKSLVTITRCTPAYRLARNQTSSSYQIFYKIQFGEPHFYAESEYQRRLVGRAPSPIGTVELYVAYKTKLLISARKTADLIHDIKDDYFDCESNPNWKRNFSEESKMPVKYIRPEDVDCPIPAKGSVRPGQKKAAFAPEMSNDFATVIDPEDLPFASLLQHARSSPICSRRKRQVSGDGIEIIVPANSMSDDDGAGDHSTLGSDLGLGISTKNIAKDDFVMVELKAPFAGQEEELGRFYRECQAAPSLSMFEEAVDFRETLSTITDQLARFEASANDFNDFINSLQAVDL